MKKRPTFMLVVSAKGIAVPMITVTRTIQGFLNQASPGDSRPSRTVKAGKGPNQ